MKNDGFNKAINNIRKVAMTPTEKKAVLERVMKSRPAHTHRPMPVRSPWSIYSFNIWIQNHRWVAVVAAVVIIIFGGNSAVMASYDALPGDTLYSLKVNVVEPVKVAFAGTPTARAEAQAELVQKRFQEAEILAARGDLDERRQKQIESRVEAQVIAFTKSVDTVSDEDTDKADDIRTTVEASVKAHRRILGAIAISRVEARGKSTATDVKVAASAPVADVASGSAVAATAPVVSVSAAPVAAPVMMAARTASFSELSEKPKQDVKNKKYSGKKAVVQSLIQTTAAATIIATTSTPSLLEENIVNEARTTLNHAEEKLQESDSHDENGDSVQARSALIESERSAKEAAEFIKAKARLEKEIKKEEIRPVLEAQNPLKEVKNRGKGKGN